jgi:hypothetical protein
VVPLVERELSDWLKRGVGTSELESFLMDVVQLPLLALGYAGWSFRAWIIFNGSSASAPVGL